MLAGIIRPGGGGATLLGQDIIDRTDLVRRRIGYVTQHFALYPELTVTEILAFYRRLYIPVSKARQAALLVQHGPAAAANRAPGLPGTGMSNFTNNTVTDTPPRTEHDIQTHCRG